MQKQNDDKGKEGMLKEALKEVKKIDEEQKKKKEVKAKKEDTSEEVKKEKAVKEKQEKKLIAVIRIRGKKGIKKNIRDTLEMLCLYKKNFCVVVESTRSIMGMIKKAKDYITWGEVNENMLNELVYKRGEKNPRDSKKTKKFFRLHPPRGGFERKGVKVPFSLGGALGYRTEKINELIKKML